MKTLNIALDIAKLRMSSDELAFHKLHGDRAVFENFLNGALRLRYPNGLEPKLQRIHMRLLDRLDACTGSDIQIEDAELDLVKDAIDNESVKFDPGATRLVSLFRERIKNCEGA